MTDELRSAIEARDKAFEEWHEAGYARTKADNRFFDANEAWRKASALVVELQAKEKSE